MQFKSLWIVAAACGLFACAHSQSHDAARCENLEQLKLDHAQVVSASVSSGGRKFSLPALFLAHKLFLEVPASCRVELVLTPTEDSHIKAEVWMPQENWNGRFYGVGNGGFAGSVDTMTLTFILQQGYAGASTDTGHESSDKDGSWALGHPEKIKDYGWRAIHETALKAKEVVAAYYGRAPQYSYFFGGSNGGRAALKEAQRFPEDYDGVMAGCPALDGTNTLPTWAWNQQQLLDTPGAYISPKKLDAIASAVVKACDAIDGVADGVLDDPRNCTFKPDSMLCKGEEADDCLTAPQAQALAKIYAGPGGALGNSKHHGFEPGGEAGDKGGWSDWFTGSKPHKSLEYIYALEFYRYLTFDDPKWDLDRFEFTRDRKAMRDAIGDALDATNPDLSAFKARGGKLLMFHGWSDGALQPRLAIDYYEAVQEKMGAASAADFTRLYMVPGMQHCIGGPGPNFLGQMPPGGSHDPARNISAALEAWVEKGRAPGSIVATKYEDDWKPIVAPEDTKVLRTRPLCPYPQVARWNGKGSTDVAENFSCTAP